MTSTEHKRLDRTAVGHVVADFCDPWPLGLHQIDLDEADAQLTVTVMSQSEERSLALLLDFLNLLAARHKVQVTFAGDGKAEVHVERQGPEFLRLYKSRAHLK